MSDPGPIIDEERRRIFITGMIEPPIAARVVPAIYHLGQSDDEIEVYVNSTGGDTCDAFAIIGALNTIPSPVTTIAMGQCMSAAVPIVACGQERWATEPTRFMVHAGYWKTEGCAQTMRKDADELQELDNIYNNLMAEYSGKDPMVWFDLSDPRGDYFFGAEEAIELGVIDYIWDERP